MLNRPGCKDFIKALGHAKSAGNRNVQLAHWLLHTLQQNLHQVDDRNGHG